MELEIKRATPLDVWDFERLWVDFLIENHKDGAEILPTIANVELYKGIYGQYARGQLDGVVLLAYDAGEPVGVLMWGDPGISFVTTFGKIAQGWGTYVVPSRRKEHVSSALSEEGIRVLREMGFQTLMGSAVVANEAGIERARALGFREHARVGVLDLGG